MVDLSKWPCPWCSIRQGVMVSESMLDGTRYQAQCEACLKSVEGDDFSEESAADAWKELSEKVHGKQLDGPTVEVRGMVVRSDSGKWVIVGTHHPDEDDPSDDEVYRSLASAFGPGERLHKHIITASIPVPAAQEIKGRLRDEHPTF